MKSRYKEKKQGAPRKQHVNIRLCRACLSKHCHCGVNTRDHFIPTPDEIEEWYGEDR